MLKDQIALVTGAARGLGRDIALTLAREGASIVATDILDGTETVEAVRAIGADALFVKADVTLADERAAIFRATAERFGRLDILVNNAGGMRKVGFFDMTPDEFDWIFDVNLKAAFFVMQAAAAVMRTQGSGRIVNIASIAGKGYRNTANIGYAGSKGALITMTRIAAAQLGRYGISANSVCPGFTETDMVLGWIEREAKLRGITTDAVRDTITAEIPLQRTNTATDVADAVLFLASPRSRNVTGQSLNIDGGIIWD
jgi:NAD(P)-dependent dehydrogenase (short-subunit alcohol dehydrogenase family)